MIEQTSYAQWVGSTIGEYRLTRLLGISPMGPLFAADSMNSAYRITSSAYSPYRPRRVRT